MRAGVALAALLTAALMAAEIAVFVTGGFAAVLRWPL